MYEMRQVEGYKNVRRKGPDRQTLVNAPVQTVKTSGIWQNIAETVKSEITAYNPYCESLTYASLACLASVFRAVLNDGAPGLGKSRSTVGLLQLLPRLSQNVRVISGHITPLAMYRLLFECRAAGCVVIIDESFTTLNHRLIQQMLRGALYSGICDWHSTGRSFRDLDLPENFVFEGRIIFNTNLINNREFNNKAMIDRVFYHRLMLSGAQIAHKMNARERYVPDRDVWKLIERRILRIRDRKLGIELTPEERDLILKFTTSRILDLSCTYNSNISMRIIERIESLFLFFKQFFGEIDWAFIRPFAENYFLVNSEENLIRKVLAENGGEMPIKDLAEAMADYHHFSLRTAHRRIREYLDIGKILNPKRGLVTLPPEIESQVGENLGR